MDKKELINEIAKYAYTDAYSEAEKEYEAEEAKKNTENK